MSDFTRTDAEKVPLSPNKRVSYTFGMVLGEDEFRQEQAHFEWKHRISNYLLHGYGTVSGLQVIEEKVSSSADTKIRVKAGYAISPQGKWVWVEHDQCASLSEWVREHEGEQDSSSTVYVTLRYAECETDEVPVAGKPCAGEENAREASRTLETAHVAFSWKAPAQKEEARTRALGDLLARVEIIPAGSSPPSDESAKLFGLVRKLGESTSPPDDGPIYLDEETAWETIREALAIWATEVRPQFAPDDDDSPILLACIDFDIDDDGNLEIDPIKNCERPVLLPDRLKQELFQLVGSVSGHGDLSGLDDDDHPQYHNDLRGDARYAPINHTHDGVDGNFVQVPADVGPYAIVAAGYFDADGNPTGDSVSYNGLYVEKPDEMKGQYLLKFELYDEWYNKGLIEAGEVTLIVKGTVVDPSLSLYREYLEELYAGEYEQDPFEYPFDPEDGERTSPYNPKFPSMAPAVFQVVELKKEGILVWITQPFLRYDLFKSLVRDDIGVEEDMNAILFTPVDKPFMVEIGAYGSILGDYFSTYADRVSINTASVEELRSLPRIGPALAGRIVELRDEVGSFTSLNQLKDVSGIDEFLVSRLRHLMRL